jgi:hypothetical protein
MPLMWQSASSLFVGLTTQRLNLPPPPGVASVRMYGAPRNSDAAFEVPDLGAFPGRNTTPDKAATGPRKSKTAGLPNAYPIRSEIGLASVMY